MAVKPQSDMFRCVEAVLFDLDGTLIDSAPDLAAAANKMLSDRAIATLPLSRYRPWAGAGARGMLSVAFGVLPEAPDFDALKEEFFTNYEATLAVQTKTFDQIKPLIAELNQAGLKWGVVTNKSQRFTRPLTAGIALFKTAGTIVSGDTTKHAKPHPEPLLFAATQLGVAPQKCVYVGDDERDILAGKAAGMMTITAGYGYLGDGVAHLDWNADASINSPAELRLLLNLHRIA